MDDYDIFNGGHRLRSQHTFVTDGPGKCSRERGQQRVLGIVLFQADKRRRCFNTIDTASGIVSAAGVNCAEEEGVCGIAVGYVGRTCGLSLAIPAVRFRGLVHRWHHNPVVRVHVKR